MEFQNHGPKKEDPAPKGTGWYKGKIPRLAFTTNLRGGGFSPIRPLAVGCARSRQKLSEAMQRGGLTSESSADLSAREQRHTGKSVHLHDHDYVRDGYDVGMTTEPDYEVLTTTEARSAITAARRRFQRDGAEAEPIVFGSHRKPQGVIISFEGYREYRELKREKQLLGAVPRPSIEVSEVTGLPVLHLNIGRKLTEEEVAEMIAEDDPQW
jgi:hypothetical protein